MFLAVKPLAGGPLTITIAFAPVTIARREFALGVSWAAAQFAFPKFRFGFRLAWGFGCLRFS